MTFFGRNVLLLLWLYLSISAVTVDRKFSKLGDCAMQKIDTKYKVFNRMKCSTYCHPDEGCTGFHYDAATKECFVGKILGSYQNIVWETDQIYKGES